MTTLRTVDACCEKCTDNSISGIWCNDEDCSCHTPHTPSSDWEKRLKDLKCVNGAMYFGSVEDDSCDCKTRCQNEQTYEHALEELTAFIHTHIENARREERERIYAELEKMKVVYETMDTGSALKALRAKDPTTNVTNKES